MTGAIGGVAVQGTADVITAGGMLIDLKTASKKPAGVSQLARAAAHDVRDACGSGSR